jgi:hypothetical protein
MSNLVRYRKGSSDTTSMPSNRIWANCPWDTIVAGDGAWLWDDFDKGGLLTAPTTIAALVGNGWSGFSSSASQVSFDDASGIKLEETTVDETTAIFQEQHPFQISRSHGDLWFEARIKSLLVATTEIGFFAGLMDTTAVTATVPLTAATALADVNLVGFYRQDAETTAFDFSYKSDGVTAVTVNDGTATIAADTYVKVGFYFDSQAYTITSFINGVKQATRAGVNTGTPAAANGYTISSGGTVTATGGFPNDIAMGVVFAMQVGAGASDNDFIIDWVKVAQRAAS